MKKVWHIVRNLILTGIIFYLLYSQLHDHLAEGIAMFSNLSIPRFLILIIVCVSTYVIGGITLCKLAHKYHPLAYKEGVRSSLLMMLGENLIGGAPAKAVPLYILHKHNFSLHESLCILGYDFLNYQLPVLCFSLLPFAVASGFFFRTYDAQVWVACLGLICDMAPILFVVVMMSSSRIQRLLSYMYHKLMDRITHQKSRSLLEKAKKSAAQFQFDKSLIKRNSSLGIELFCWNILRLSLRNLIPLISIWALHIPISSDDILYLWLAAIFLELLMSMVPLAGKHGVAEASFIFVYAPFIHSVNAVAAMLLWRLSFYYINTVIAALTLVFSHNLTMHDLLHFRA